LFRVVGVLFVPVLVAELGFDALVFDDGAL
jgi:hypothetical protein